VDHARSEGLTRAVLNEDAHFFFPSNDGYWLGGATVADRPYEPEIHWLLRRAMDRKAPFIDCGANMGYWSVLASSAPYGRHAVVAIEASRANVAILKMNADVNNGRFPVLRRAIFRESDLRVRLYGQRHYGMSLRSDWHVDGSAYSEEVETISIDDVAKRFLPNREYPALLKIDVEGAEVEAIKGARATIDEGALFVFEDHGKEPAHPACRFVLAQQGMDMWHVGTNLEPIRITTIEQVAAIKQDPLTGYNFFAHRRISPWASIFTKD
jgi:FkbM family methyltransferase